MANCLLPRVVFGSSRRFHLHIYSSTYNRVTHFHPPILFSLCSHCLSVSVYLQQRHIDSFALFPRRISLCHHVYYTFLILQCALAPIFSTTNIAVSALTLLFFALDFFFIKVCFSVFLTLLCYFVSLELNAVFLISGLQ